MTECIFKYELNRNNATLLHWSQLFNSPFGTVDQYEVF